MTGESWASLLLDDLSVHAAVLDEAKIATFVAALFTIADELNAKSDANRSFAGFGDNSLRLHWLLNRLVHALFPMGQREAIYRNAMTGVRQPGRSISRAGATTSLHLEKAQRTAASQSSSKPSHTHS